MIFCQFYTYIFPRKCSWLRQTCSRCQPKELKFRSKWWRFYLKSSRFDQNIRTYDQNIYDYDQMFKISTKIVEISTEMIEILDRTFWNFCWNVTDLVPAIEKVLYSIFQGLARGYYAERPRSRRVLGPVKYPVFTIVSFIHITINSNIW